jgi:hypothetical protein
MPTDDQILAYHETGQFGFPIEFVSIDPHDGCAGVTRLDRRAVRDDDFGLIVLKIAGPVAETHFTGALGSR